MVSIALKYKILRKEFSIYISNAKSEGLVNKCGVSIYTPEEAKIAPQKSNC